MLYCGPNSPGVPPVQRHVPLGSAFGSTTDGVCGKVPLVSSRNVATVCSIQRQDVKARRNST